MSERAVFLDRDGTIAYDARYCSTPDDFYLLPSAPGAIKMLNQDGFKVILVTNQSGLARGLFDETTLGLIHEKMHRVLAGHGAMIDAVYYCPHHPDEKCDCRKPATKLYRQAADEHQIDMKTSFVVGDTQMDIAAGKALGCRTVLVTTGPTSGKDLTVKPDYTASSMLDAAEWILKQV